MTQDTQTNTPIMQLDVISDVICPWCFIGKRNLDAALNQLSGLRINLMWRPYQLDPRTPPEGHDRETQMKRKFGPDGGKQIYQNIIAAAQGTGINFAFDKITRTPNTLNAHRLIRWAASTHQQHDIAEALFVAYFENGHDIGDVNVLLEIAAAHDMDTKLLAALFASDTDIENTQNDDAAARDLGIAGVPAFLAGGKFVLSGAQEPAYLLKFIGKAQSKLASL
ncbi:DsbA family oxidoreductase [Alphaproteobacteria bacterium]|nr:DsbA family oxidoreductase [Alphaproteobacteria bacterium]